MGSAYDELMELYHVSDHSLWFIRPYEIEEINGMLRFVQNGKSISDFCSRFNEDESDLISRHIVQQDLKGALENV